MRNSCPNAFTLCLALVLAAGLVACGGGDSSTDAGRDATGPGDVSDPGTPGDPGVPEDPGTVDDPGVPQDPGDPEDPGIPEDPGVPQDPGDPEDPGAPEDPGVGDDPGQPADVPADAATDEGPADVPTDPNPYPGSFVPGGPVTLMDQDFDNVPVGALGNPWLVMLTGGTATVETLAGKSASGHVLKVVDGAAADESGAVHYPLGDGPRLLDNKDVEVSFDLLLPTDTPHYVRVMLTNNASGPKDLGVTFDSGEIWARYDNTWADCQTTLPLGQWISIRWIYRYTTQTITVEVDGAPTGCNDKPLAAPEGALAPNRLLINVPGTVNGTPVGGTYYFDHLKVRRLDSMWIEDTVHERVWALAMPDGPMNQDDAWDWCESQSFPPYDGWRVPTIEELRTLVIDCPATAPGGACGILDDCTDPTTCGGAACDGCTTYGGGINGCYWPFVGQECLQALWSTTASPSGFWGISFAQGAPMTFPGTDLLSVRCVANRIQ
jgi:hypothetical protein